MDFSTKTIFTKINNSDTYFSEIIEKVTKHLEITNKEYSYILSLSTLFYDEYLRKEKNGYLEFSYYLVLNYSIMTNDYTPLLMFSINNGLYPIAKSIFSNYEMNIQDILYDTEIDFYKKKNIYELKKQYETRKALIESTAQNRAYIAPTSYGKSTAIIEDIYSHQLPKIGIIVPKKALIWQTFRNIKAMAKELNYKVLLHDSDYLNEEKVICIFTQERAIRLIQDNTFSFDTLYIDEAHNLFEKDERNILLARLIKLNKKLNSYQRIVYLSPLVKDANDFIFSNNEIVEMQKIDFNIKEIAVKLFPQNGQVEVYNRFVDQYYKTNEVYSNYYDYIYANLGKKNLFYFNKPKDIEEFAQNLLRNIKSGKILISELTDNKEIIDFSSMISKYVDKDYYLVELIKYGIVYIHGKMPDLIKDYVINKFTSIKEMKLLISNSSVLEGMNLSIDSLFIFDAYGLHQNDLINLCGRVNRLSDIFSHNDLSKLLCKIHFVDIGLNNINIKNKISLLRSDETDDVLNPLLKKSKPDEKGKIIAKRENDYIDNHQSNDVKTILIKNSLTSVYYDVNLAASYIENLLNDSSVKKLSMMDKISKVFFNNCENVSDFELSRLSKREAVSFYDLYISRVYNLDLKSKVKYFVNYFEKTQNENFFIGESFGEIPSEFNPRRNVYINVKNKSYKEKINLAVVKAKIEDDFIGFKIGKLVKTLLDLKLIEEHDYDKFLYGTNDNSKVQLIKMGISPMILKFIEEYHLESEYEIINGMIVISDIFKERLREQDDFIRFEICKLVY